MHAPRYDGDNIVNLMSSLQRGLGGGETGYASLRQLAPDTVREHRQVLLWVIDGLGYEYLRAQPQASTLNGHLAGSMSTVFPTTTASAITTYLTGDAPQQHALTGWHMYFRELGSVLAVLPARARFGGGTLDAAGIDIGQMLQHRPFSERIAVDSHSVSPANIAESDFNRAHLGRARLAAYDGLDGLVAACHACLQPPGERYVYAYWSQLDGLGHRHGIHSTQAKQHLLELDRAFARLLEGLHGSDTLVIVCADHGQVDTTPQSWIDLADHAPLHDCLALPLCGEPRAAYCYLRPGTESAFDAYVARHLAGIADNLRGAQMIADGWFGTGPPHPELARRVGDRVLLMRENFAIKDWLPFERHFSVVGVHGGLSRAECLVPLITASC